MAIMPPNGDSLAVCRTENAALRGTIRVLEERVRTLERALAKERRASLPRGDRTPDRRGGPRLEQMFTDDQIRAIRADTRALRAIGGDYKTSYETVRLIKARKTYRYVEDDK